MPCAGCEKRREWIKQQVSNMMSRVYVPSPATTAVKVRGVPVTLKTEGKIATVFYHKKEIGTVEGNTEQERFTKVAKLLEELGIASRHRPS